jgi:hypothetical protein
MTAFSWDAPYLEIYDFIVVSWTSSDQSISIFSISATTHEEDYQMLKHTKERMHQLPFIREHHMVDTQLLCDQCVRVLLLVPDSYAPTLGMAALEHDF